MSQFYFQAYRRFEILELLLISHEKLFFAKEIVKTSNLYIIRKFYTKTMQLVIWGRFYSVLQIFIQHAFGYLRSELTLTILSTSDIYFRNLLIFVLQCQNDIVCYTLHYAHKAIVCLCTLLFRKNVSLIKEMYIFILLIVYQEIMSRSIV